MTTSLARTVDRKTTNASQNIASARLSLVSQANDDFGFFDVERLAVAVGQVARAVGQHEAWRQTGLVVQEYGDNTAGAVEAATRTLLDLLLDGADDKGGNRLNDVKRSEFDGFRQAATEIISLLNLVVR